MDIEGQVKDGDNVEKWKQRNSAEITTANEKSTINAFNILGTIIVIAGLVAGLVSSWNALITNVSLGIIIIGIGEALRYLNKLTNK